MSPKGLELMPKLDTSKNNRILLCACKKYTKDQQNGILLVNPQLGDNQNVENPFYNTGNVEIYCFCPKILSPIEILGVFLIIVNLIVVFCLRVL